MSKQVCVISGDRTADISIDVGSTTADVLNELNLPSDYFLSPRDGQPFGQHEQIYGSITSGQKLYASPAASVAG